MSLQQAINNHSVTSHRTLTEPLPTPDPPLNKTTFINYFRILFFVVDLIVVYCFADAYMHVIDCSSYKMVIAVFELAIFILTITLAMAKQIQYWRLKIRNVIEFWILWDSGDLYRFKRIQCDTNFGTVISDTEYKIDQSYRIGYDQHSEMILARINDFYMIVIVVKTINAIWKHKMDTSIKSEFKFDGNTNIWYALSIKAIIALMIINHGKFSVNIHSIDSFYVMTKKPKNSYATITIIRVLETIVSVGRVVKQGSVVRVGVDVNDIFEMIFVFDILSKLSTSILLSDTITSMCNETSLNLNNLSKFQGGHGNSGCVIIIINNFYPISGTAIVIRFFSSGIYFIMQLKAMDKSSNTGLLIELKVMIVAMYQLALELSIQSSIITIYSHTQAIYTVCINNHCTSSDDSRHFGNSNGIEHDRVGGNEFDKSGRDGGDGSGNLLQSNACWKQNR